MADDPSNAVVVST